MLFFQLFAKFISLEKAVLYSSKENIVRMIKEHPAFANQIYTALDRVVPKKGFTRVDIQRLVEQQSPKIQKPEELETRADESPPVAQVQQAHVSVPFVSRGSIPSGVSYLPSLASLHERPLIAIEQSYSRQVEEPWRRVIRVSNEASLAAQRRETELRQNAQALQEAQIDYQAMVTKLERAAEAEQDPIEKERMKVALQSLRSMDIPISFLEQFKRENPDIIPELRAHYPDYRVMLILAYGYRPNRDNIVAFLRAFVMYGLNKKRTIEEQGKFLKQYIKPILNISNRDKIIEHMKHSLETSNSVEFDDLLFLMFYIEDDASRLSALNTFTQEQRTSITAQIQRMRRSMESHRGRIMDPRDAVVQEELERKQRAAAEIEQNRRSQALRFR